MVPRSVSAPTASPWSWSRMRSILVSVRSVRFGGSSPVGGGEAAERAPRGAGVVEPEAVDLGVRQEREVRRQLADGVEVGHRARLADGPARVELEPAHPPPHLLLTAAHGRGSPPARR